MARGLNFEIKYIPETEIYKATCLEYPHLNFLDDSPQEALRRLIRWIRERD